MPNNVDRVSAKFKTKQEIQQARKERDAAILNLKKQLAAAKVKERELIELGKVEQRKFAEEEKANKAKIMKEVNEQSKLITLNKNEIKLEKAKAKEELKLKNAEIANALREFKNENKRQQKLIKERVEAEKFEAKKRMEELRHKEIEEKLKLDQALEEQKIKAAAEAAEAQKMIIEKKRDLVEHQEMLRIKRAEAKSILIANKNQKLAEIRAEQLKIMELEREEKNKLVQREYEIKTGRTIGAIAAVDEIAKLSNEAKANINAANLKLDQEIEEMNAIHAEDTIVVPEHIEDTKFAYDEKVFEQDASVTNTDEIRLAEARVVTSFGKQASKLFARSQMEPSAAGNKNVQKRNETLYSETAEFTRTIDAESPISISSIVLAVNAITKKYTLEEVKEFNWQFTAALLIGQSIKFGNGYIVPNIIDGLRHAVFAEDAQMSEYAQFLESEFEELLNIIINEKIESGAAILLSKNLLVKKHDGETKVFANTPYLLA